jgi:arabinan endo-1,5-alpha-L-arabinosidase
VSILIFLSFACESNNKINKNSLYYPEAHDVSRIVMDDGIPIVYFSGIESVYYDDSQGGWLPALGQYGEFPLTGNQEPTWLIDSPVSDIVGSTAPAMFDDRDMLYCKADWEADDGSACIGRATASGEAPLDLNWEDIGTPLICSDSDLLSQGAPFAIDPASFEENGREWLIYGSHGSGIWMAELDTETGLLINDAGWSSDNENFTHLANYPDGAEENYIEAPFLFKNDSFYYLFVNWDQCCMGVDSTYNIRVGRSENIRGPYLDKSGVSMAEGGGRLFLESEGRFVGPGHPGISDLPDIGYVFSYHFYDAENNGIGTLGTRKLHFVEGWPELMDEEFSLP